jgi:alkylated DNA repair protein alkB family protein 7
MMIRIIRHHHHHHRHYHYQYKRLLHSQLYIHENIIDDNESNILCQWIDNKVKKKRYLSDHFDHVISNYKEFEYINNNNNDDNNNNNDNNNNDDKIGTIMKRISQIVIQNSKINNIELLNPHVIDLSEDGYIGPHVDSIKFSGHLIAGLSLLSTRILSLVPVNSDNKEVIELYIKPKSLYILTNELRFDYSHSILGKNCSPQKLQPIEVKRRLSIMFRDTI